MRIRYLVVCCLCVLSFHAFSGFSFGQPGLSQADQALLTEHVYKGLPESTAPLIRKGYVLSYDSAKRVPKWVAYHISSDYLSTPKRKGKFKSFRKDPDITNPVKDGDYNGLFASRGYARGHLAPYAVMGGDRDGDGKLAKDDPDDAKTIFEANFMSNIAPQQHYAFNGSGGMWFNLERWAQKFAKNHSEVWVFAGCIFGTGEHEKVGPANDIFVPDMFYKIVIWEDPDIDSPIVLAFLFPHHRTKHGEIQDFLTSIDVIEGLTGLDFLNDLEDSLENLIEGKDTWETWEAINGN